MANISQIKSYIQYITNHRKENKLELKATKHKYNVEIRGCISASIFAHDLEKIFTFKLLKYVDNYIDVINDNILPDEIFNKSFSIHDGWIYSPLAIEILRPTELFKYISKFNKSSYIASEDEIYEVIDNIKMLCEMFGEDPRAFYLRNYNCFRFGNSSLARKVIEFELDLDFHDYHNRGTHSLTVYDIFDKQNKHFNPGLVYHAFITCLTQYGVNICEALGLNDTYEGINDRV